LHKTEFDVSSVEYCKIHPAIAIARLGNSSEEYFIGPEVPGQPPQPEDNLFKDKSGKIKRQAARFRIYSYDANDKVIKELTSDDCTIGWKVHLANKKAENNLFVGRFDHQTDVKRNSSIVNRKDLIIDPGSRSISGKNQNGDKYKFDTGKFLGTPVQLGELRTDQKGRLIVLGGYGKSDSIDFEKYPIKQYANNDGWYDDTSDGPVTATVVFDNEKHIPVKDSAWVIVAPPKFAPYHYPIVTLFDTMREFALNQKWIIPPKEVSFMRDIYPIFFRAVQYAWLNEMAERGHGQGTILTKLKNLADNSQEKAKLRKMIFNRIRNPYLINNPQSKEAIEQAEPYYMPPMSGDGGEANEGNIERWMAILPSQYENLRRWSDGDFINDWQQDSQIELHQQMKLEDMLLEEQPSACDKAALDLSIGSPFFPGIEITYIVWDPSLYDGKPFRINHNLEPGDITKHMAIPWQADFWACSDDWWPSARPDDVIPDREGTINPTDPTVRKKWARKTDESEITKYEEMVHEWSKLGIIKPTNINNEIFFVETERS
jgi:L-Lysine epsilon oxidase N-terminal/L-lysine epsilon oxidase C-terminal domain